MKKILLSIFALMGPSQTMSSDGPDYRELKTELALLEKLRERATDERFSRLPVVPPIRRHQPKPPSGKPTKYTRPGHRKHPAGPKEFLNQTYTIENEKQPQKRKPWDKSQKEKIIKALKKLPLQK